MTSRLRPEGIDFVTTAPDSFVFEALVAAPRPVVWAAITADPVTWTWFPGMRNGSYLTEAPHGVGSGRRITIGGTVYRETIVAWDEPSRWAYRVDESTAPLARALVEEWSLAEDTDGDGGRDGAGTVVRWTFALDPTPLFTVGRPAAALVMGTLFRKAMANLSAHLVATTAPPAR